MATDPLTSTQLDNAYFNLLTPQQREMMSDFGKNMYSNFNKYQTPVEKSSVVIPKLTDEEEIEWIVQQIMSGLQLHDISSRGKKLLKRKYGKKWESKLFQ
jgi:hypothetical protein